MSLEPSASFSLSFNRSVQILQKKSLYIASTKLKDDIFAIHGIFSDSRKTAKNSVFIAYQGVNQDLHSFITPDLQRNCRFIVCENKKYLEDSLCPVIVVKDARAAWSHLAALGWKNPQESLSFVGVTGTNGKTSVCHMISSMLHENKFPCLGIGTLGSYFEGKWHEGRHTTPDPDVFYQTLAFAKEKRLLNVVMEVSSHALAMQKLLPILFDIAIFTSFSQDHLDLHGSMAAYWEEKMRLFRENSTPKTLFIVNHSIYQKFQKVSSNNETYSYGAKNTPTSKRSYYFSNLIFKKGTSHFTIVNTSKKNNTEQEFSLPILGMPIVENFCAAHLTTQRILNKSCFLVPDAIVPPGRMQLVPTKNDKKPSVIIDYAHTPDALEQSLKELKALAKNTASRVYVVFGCGGDRDTSKRSLMGLAATKYADVVLITSDNPRSEDPLQIISQIKAGIDPNLKVFVIADRHEAIQKSLELAGPEDLILIAGKGHETHQIVGDQKLHFDDFKVADGLLNA